MHRKYAQIGLGVITLLHFTCHALADQNMGYTNAISLAISGEVKAATCLMVATVNDGKPNERIMVKPLVQQSNSVSGVAYFSIGLRELGALGTNCSRNNKLSTIQFDSVAKNASLLAPARTDRQELSVANLSTELMLFNADWTQYTLVSQQRGAGYDFRRASNLLSAAPSATEERLNFGIRYTVASPDGSALSPGDFFVTLPFLIGLQ